MQSRSSEYGEGGLALFLFNYFKVFYFYISKLLYHLHNLFVKGLRDLKD